MTITERLNNLTVYLFGKPYKIECKPGIGKSECYVGACDVFSDSIQIEGNISDYDKVSTVLHEIIDATNRRLELEIPHGKLCLLEAVVMSTLGSCPALADLIKEAGAAMNGSPLDQITNSQPKLPEVVDLRSSGAY
jgi:hypothetical protein